MAACRFGVSGDHCRSDRHTAPGRAIDGSTTWTDSRHSAPKTPRTCRTICIRTRQATSALANGSRRCCLTGQGSPVVEKPVCWLFPLATALAPAAEENPLEFRHGISLIHVSGEFAELRLHEFQRVQGRALRLLIDIPIRNFSDVWDEDAVPAPGMHRNYDHLLHRAGDELRGLYGHLAQGMALAPRGVRCNSDCIPINGGTTARQSPRRT